MEPKTAFLKLFGDSPVLRVLDFLMVHEAFDYSMTDIAKLSEVGYATLKLFWPRLESLQIVKNTRKVGKAKMYQLNDKNPSVKKFKELYWQVTHEAIDRLVKEEIENKKEKIELVT